MDPEYAVVAFPGLDRADSVEVVRQRFDPQATLIAAHVTIVFPFRGGPGEAELADHVERAAAGVPPFAIALTSLSAEAGGYLFLNVGEGAERFEDLNARLYTGPLARHRSSAHVYRPHVTVGQIPEGDELTMASQEAYLALGLPMRGTVIELAVFRLEGQGRGTVIYRAPLRSAGGGDTASL